MTPVSSLKSSFRHPTVFEDLSVGHRNVAKLLAFPNAAVFGVESPDAGGTSQTEVVGAVARTGTEPGLARQEI